MSSKPSRTSKDSYSGINVRRMPRSEFDDNMMRDLTRHDNRLDHNLKTVERAKEVMLRSYESDKNMFLRGGVKTNKKYITAIKNPGDSRQKREVPSQPSKYQPDNRKSRQLNGTVAPQPDSVIDSVDKGRRDSNNGSSESQDVTERRKRSDPQMDDYLNNGSRLSESSIPPAIKVKDHQTPDGDDINNVEQEGGQPITFYDDLSSYARRPGFWNYLSQPKNPSRNLQVREQLEREFSSTNLGTRAKTPSAKSAKGGRTLSSSSIGSSSTSSNRAKSAAGSKNKSSGEGKASKGKGK